MSASGVDDDALRNSASAGVTGQVMVIIIIVIFFVVVLILCLNLYLRWFWWRIDLQQPRDPNSSARRFLFASGQDPAAALRAGLDPAILKKIPVVGFSISQQEFKDGLECAVCLCELEDGEKARLLPLCNHGFHVECIDMWFQSHSTCPLCRNPVAVAEEGESTVEIDIQSSPGSSESSPNFPTNVLFWGDETQVSSASAAAASASSSSSTETSSGSSRSRGPESLVIEIPSSSTSEHLSSSVSVDEDSKTPVTTRIRSLKRLLSWK